MASNIHYQCFPRTEPPAHFVECLVDVFRAHEDTVGTLRLAKGRTSDEMLSTLAQDLAALGFDVEQGKRADQKIHRPVFFGESWQPTLKYEVDAFPCSDTQGSRCPTNSPSSATRNIPNDATNPCN